MASQAPGFLASGNISPSVAVKLDPTGNFHVLQAAAATDATIGIAQDGTYYAPGVAGSDGYAAHAGQTLAVYGEGEQCLWKVGASGITAGDQLTSDANGLAKTIAFTAGSGHVYQTARALETANAGELARVVVELDVIYGITA